MRYAVWGGDASSRTSTRSARACVAAAPSTKNRTAVRLFPEKEFRLQSTRTCSSPRQGKCILKTHRVRVRSADSSRAGQCRARLRVSSASHPRRPIRRSSWRPPRSRRRPRRSRRPRGGPIGVVVDRATSRCEGRRDRSRPRPRPRPSRRRRPPPAPPARSSASSSRAARKAWASRSRARS